FYTSFRREQWEKARNKPGTLLDNDSRGGVQPIDELEIEKFGTVGCVALDAQGNLAAATSTGGLVNKKYNRIGDSPLIGAGTYADNQTCAVSCTGRGEEFIRLVVAYDIAAQMHYAQRSLRSAANHTILQELKRMGGRGGCIALDRSGHIAMPFTTSGMFRGKIGPDGKKSVEIYKKK
ncbi:MAG: isoaspartyl peptidase/L-asparaginase, partial [Saprospiraceae bacterium]